MLISLAALSLAAQVAAQEPPAPPAQAHQHQMSPNGWTWMHDGVLFVTFNSQGGDRGRREVRSQNWFMGMATHQLGPGALTLTGMFSAEPLTLTAAGYSELFQMGEAYKGLENIDRQHPHDLFSQLAAIWRVPLGGSSAFTVAGGPVGEATLGPIAFMHRPSASENPTAPLGHHTFDSTHIVQGVIAAAVDVGAFTAEGSAFRGREPDEDRYDIDHGALDSWAARLWYRPSGSWAAQVSHGFLKQPEQLEPGNIRRTTASISWLRERGQNLAAVSALVGHNQRTYTELTAFLTEALVRRGKNGVYSRIEVLEIETEHLLFPTVVHKPHPGELIDVLRAFTGGLVRDVSLRGPLNLAVGADVTFYTVPSRLQPYYGTRPVSAHVFLRVRPRAGAIGRMWNMTMTRPMMMGR